VNRPEKPARLSNFAVLLQMIEILGVCSGASSGAWGSVHLADDDRIALIRLSVDGIRAVATIAAFPRTTAWLPSFFPSCGLVCAGDLAAANPERECPEIWRRWARFSVISRMEGTASALVFIASPYSWSYSSAHLWQ
jgi:hypothetical protein